KAAAPRSCSTSHWRSDMAKGESATQMDTATTLLIVDDERSLHMSIGEWAREAGYHVLDAYSGREGLALAREQPVDVVLLDLRLGDVDGLQVLRKIREEDPLLPVVMISAHGEIHHALEATNKLGAYTWIPKRGDLDLDNIGVTLRNALRDSRQRQEIERLRSEQQASQPILGESAALRGVLQRAAKAARSSTATVLLNGETGVGRELRARSLPQQSARAEGPFVEINCSALPENLLESELFGFEKGAFTDARRSKKGMFEIASGGTLFLDEIGELNPTLQAKLLRVLESKRFRRVGGPVDILLDPRVVAATNRDLAAAVAEKVFREDLYFRLNVIPIEIPPLRRRPEDLKALIDHY